MSEAAATTCPRCGAAAAGNFCAACGGRLAPPACPGCGQVADAGDRYCTRCGTDLGAVTPRPAEPRTPWVVAGLLSVITIAAVLWAAGGRGDAPGPQMADAGNPAQAGGAPLGTAPPLDDIPPREQFTRLHDRIMRAAEAGDTSTVINFWPMAAGAYSNLSDADRDVDARYHMATLHLLLGQTPATLALADTILAADAGNLMGWYLRAVTADFAGDSAAVAAARREYRERYPTEIRRDRLEYTEHAPLLREFMTQAGGTP